MKIDLRTKNEKSKAELRAKIVADFKDVWKRTETTPNRVISMLAEKYDYSSENIKKILINDGVYVANAGKPVINLRSRKDY